MKNVALISIYDLNNFGNRLQNYALYIFIKKLGLGCEIIRNDDFQLITKFKIIVKKILNYKQKSEKQILREKKFKKFNESNMVFSKRIYNYYSPKKISGFNNYVVGSDQVWNPCIKRMSKLDLLTNINGNKISFSASFGVSELPDNIKKQASKELIKFKAISVREDAGKKIVEDLTGRNDVEVLVDPTMLLTSKDWDKVSIKPKMLDCKKYILNYFLGELSNDKKVEIERVAKENGCEIINILDLKSKYYVCGPSEFLYLEKHAFLICTDSFHSCVFAILYNRPFIVFDRKQNNLKSMTSRIDTLLNKFDLNNRRFSGKIKKVDLECNYEKSYKILANERKKSEDFLTKALK